MVAGTRPVQGVSCSRRSPADPDKSHTKMNALDLRGLRPVILSLDLKKEHLLTKGTRDVKLLA
jgi:hypothetical protein